MRIEYGVCNVGYSACYVDYSHSDVQLEVTIHRIKMLDPIEWWPWDHADWAYRLSVDNGNYVNNVFNKKYSEGEDDQTKDVIHRFNLYTTTPEITIKAWDRDDIWPDGPDLADVSGHEGWGEDNSIPDKRGAIFHCKYDVVNDELIVIDEIQIDGDYYVTSGEFDNNAGGEPDDGNDAKIWFQITDNYVPQPDLECNGELRWEDVKPGETAEGSFTVENIGDSGSKLDWEITEWPEWGTWLFDPISGTDLEPEEGPVTVYIILEAPDQQNQEFFGEIKIVNMENGNDYDIIPVDLITSKTYQKWRSNNLLTFFMNLIKNLMFYKILNISS